MISTLTMNKDSGYVDSLIRNSIPDQPIPLNDDQGLAGNIPWYDMKYSPKGWRTITVPGYWEDQGLRDFDGVVWYRKEINIPPSMRSAVKDCTWKNR